MAKSKQKVPSTAPAAVASREPDKQARQPTPSSASPSSASVQEGRTRAVIDAVLPTIDGGRFPVKRIAGEAVDIEAHCFTDGHDKLRVVFRWQLVGNNEVREVDMKAAPNDVWRAQFTPAAPGRYRYSV